MSTTKQGAGNDAKQIGSVEGNVTIYGPAKGFDAWGCMAVGIVAVVIVAVAAVIVNGQMINPQPTPPIPAPASNRYETEVASITTDRIQLPQNADFSPQEQQAIAQLIIAADIAEIEAVFYQDDSYLKEAYAGDALSTAQQYIDEVKQTGLVTLPLIDLDRSYFTSMRSVGDSVIAVDQCEYWMNLNFDPQSGQQVSQTDWQLVPQTINIELVESQLKVTAISFYSTRAFCTQ